MQNISNYMDQFNTITCSHSFIAAVLGVAIGVILCFLGYKLCEFFIGFFSFALVGAIGVGVSMNFTDNWMIKLAVFLIAGVIGAILAIKLYKVGAFIFTFFVGFGAVIQAMGSVTGLSLIVGAVAGVVAGVFAVILTKHVLIIITAIAGAYSIALNLGELIKLESMYIIAISVLVGVIGLIVQYLTDRVSPKKIGSRSEDDEDLFHSNDKASASTSQKEEAIESMRLDGEEIIDSASTLQKKPTEETKDTPAKKRGIKSRINRRAPKNEE